MKKTITTPTTTCLERHPAPALPHRKYQFPVFKNLLLSFFCLLFVSHAQAQLIGWDASNNGGGFGATPWAPVTLNSNLTIANTGLIRGSSILTSGTPAGGCWGGGGGGWGTTDPGSVYFSFTANTGYNVSLSSISSALRRSSSGPTTCNVEYSLNGGAYVNVGAWTVSSTSGTTGTANSTSLSGITALQNVAAGTVIKFRISFPGSPGGNWYLTGATNSLRLNGIVVPAVSCTAPSGLAASNVTTTDADLDWASQSGITGYEYVIDQTAALPAGTGTAVTTNSYAATGLTPGSTYYAHVRTNCGSGNFSSWTTVSFTTTAVCATPSITAISSNTVICAGSSLGLSVTATGTALSYTWTGAGTFSAANNNSLTVTNPTSSAYTVSISNACGTASAAVNVTVSPLPLITANSPSICAGTAGTLTATGADTYTWSTGQASASITVNPASAMTYTVHGTNLFGCTNSFTTSVNVNVLPVITVNSPSLCVGSTETLTAHGATSYTWSTGQAANSVTVNPVATTDYTVTGTDLNGCSDMAVATVSVHALPSLTVNSPSVCAGNTATLTVTGAVSYTWNTTQTTSSISVNPMTSTAYTLSGTDMNGCSNTTTASVTVNALPVILVNTPSICTGNSATLTASGASSYTWNTTQTTASISVNPTATTVYTVTGVDLNGCSAATTASVMVNALPLVSANSPSLCAGSTATLTASGAVTYTWSTTQTTVSITVNPATNTTYTVSGTDLNGCAGVYTVTVTVQAAPALTVNASTICAGGTATLTASGATTYTWSTGSNNSSITANPLSTTVYTVSASQAGCIATVVKTTTVTVSALPAVSISTISSILCNTSNTVNLAGTPSGGTFSGAGVVGNTFNPQAAGTGTFTISYTYTGSNACSNVAHSAIMVANCTGIEESLNGAGLEVYPNPAQEVVYVNMPGTNAYTVTVYSMTGKQVYSGKTSETLHAIDLREFSKGLYILNVSSPQGQVSKKILVH